MKEIWKDIPEYEGLYQVSNLGRVKSLPKWRNNRFGGYMQKEKILKSATSKYGYKKVALRSNGISRTFEINRLVVLAFLDKDYVSKGLVCDHIDHNSSNNNLSNLQLISHRKNTSKDKWRKGKISKYTGVDWHKGMKKWRARIRIGKDRIILGYFINEEDAAKAYQNKLKEINHGKLLRR